MEIKSGHSAAAATFAVSPSSAWTTENPTHSTSAASMRESGGRAEGLLWRGHAAQQAQRFLDQRRAEHKAGSVA
ncbi:MAG: hypothetical protein MJE77_38645 [Proteobacteria bacterium]|nr:hypothetical protein [Pseudomonadota bacterium]